MGHEDPIHGFDIHLDRIGGIVDLDLPRLLPLEVPFPNVSTKGLITSNGLSSSLALVGGLEFEFQTTSG